MPLIFWANEAVDLFFMLSGFIFCYTHSSVGTIDWRQFYIARFARIYPVYALAVSVVIGLDLVTYLRYNAISRSLSPLRITKNLLGVQAWWGHATSESINLPSWSVSAEIFLYVACFPLLILLFGTSARSSVLRCIVLATLGALSIAGCYHYGHLHDAPRPIIRGVAGFSIGFVLCSLLRTQQWRCRHPLGLAIAGLLSLYLFGFLQLAFLPWLNHVAMMLGFVCLVYGTFENESLPGQILSARCFQFLGTISYSLYLWHIPAMLFLHRAAKYVTGSDGIEKSQWFVIILLPWVMGLSIISYYCFEAPLRGRIRSWL